MTVPASAPLCVIPAHLRTAEDAEALMRCLVSLSVTAPQAGVMVVDDATPDADLRDTLRMMSSELGLQHYVLQAQGGFATAANVGLARALLGGRDAVLLRQDVELTQAGWLEHMLARTDTKGRPAAVVGARIVTSRGRLRSAGWQFSQLARQWAPRFEHASADLPAALQPCRCPVSSDLMLIRHSALEAIGTLDATYLVGGEDVDLCLRVFGAGAECIYEPAVVALRGATADVAPSKRHAELADESRQHLAGRWATSDLSPFVQEAL
jgi:GT2 family glycosyltransferase